MLKKANIQWSGKAMAKKVANGDVLFDCAVQRGSVWDHERKSLLIHSMIENYPIPAFYFARREDGKYDALDGKQRSNAIADFINGKYPLTDGLPAVHNENGAEEDLSGMSFENLPEWARDAICDYSLTIYYFEGITEDEVSELFFRINNGKPLSTFDLTRVKAKSLREFQQIANEPIILQTVTDRGREGNANENIAMQAWAVCFTEMPSFEAKGFRQLIENATVTQEQIDTLHAALAYIQHTFDQLSDENTQQKRVLKKLKTRTNLVSAIYLAKICIEDDIDSDTFGSMIIEFFNTKSTTSVDYTYNLSVGAGSARAENVAKRLAMMRMLEEAHRKKGEN